MVQLRAFRRLLRVLALALCSTVIVVSISPASARPHHGAGRHARAYHAGHHAKHHHARAHHWRRVRVSRFERGVAQMQVQGLADSNASLSPEPQQAASLGSSNIVDEARRHLGGNPTSRGSLWCARFMNMVLQHSGYRGTGSDMASSFAHYGQRVSGPQVGAIAVMSRGRRGGHVGIITGIDAKGNPIMISGNNGNRVREAPVSRGRIYAYVMPTN
ncbi:TIGR02594 family protein [Bradyrhizobium neotropicale]|uniref:TIGR02594 family protein n=1 Tax=Bradyrhizobium neotropicale TaxID=1497615 RepID=UPI001AD65F43|nr:TIGR02594 family protein [Bradyrhizobium neotropicale]MBO4226496.1 TIGR02594 family protein [Bradyrhizobium neotropicale]